MIDDLEGRLAALLTDDHLSIAPPPDAARRILDGARRARRRTVSARAVTVVVAGTAAGGALVTVPGGIVGGAGHIDPATGGPRPPCVPIADSLAPTPPTSDPDSTADPHQTAHPDVTADPDSTADPHQTAHPDVTADPSQTLSPPGPLATSYPSGSVPGMTALPGPMRRPDGTLLCEQRSDGTLRLLAEDGSIWPTARPWPSEVSVGPPSGSPAPPTEGGR